MINWKWCPFHQLSLMEFHDAIHLRETVFVLEQNCVYLDVDGKDPHSWHLLGYQENTPTPQLVAYLRVVPPGLKYKEHSLGRVVTAPSVRGSGTGRALVKKAIELLTQEFGPHPIRISAQAHLEKFYGSFGFKTVSEEYLEDGIPHVEMFRA